MLAALRHRSVVLLVPLLAACLSSGGCATVATQQVAPPELLAAIDFNPHPRESAMIALPPYVIDSPDILVINAVRLVPKGVYKIEPLDALLITVRNALPRAPIEGVFVVETEGMVNLGDPYGLIPVAGKSLEEARQAITAHLKDNKILDDPQVTIGLAQSRGLQQIRGEHLVRPDGSVGLGTYGSVVVAGMTLQQAKAAIETHLGQYLLMPEIALDVFAYNSKVYYVIFDGGGYGQEIIRLPITGNETVLDALSNPLVSGLPAFSSTHKIWLARPAQGPEGRQEVLPVDWAAITQGALTATNYQLQPGDRLYVKADHWVEFDNVVAKVLSPFERMLGFILLGSETYNSITGRITSTSGTN